MEYFNGGWDNGGLVPDDPFIISGFREEPYLYDGDLIGCYVEEDNLEKAKIRAELLRQKWLLQNRIDSSLSVETDDSLVRSILNYQAMTLEIEFLAKEIENSNTEIASKLLEIIGRRLKEVNEKPCFERICITQEMRKRMKCPFEPWMETEKKCEKQ